MRRPQPYAAKGTRGPTSHPATSAIQPSAPLRTCASSSLGFRCSRLLCSSRRLRFRFWVYPNSALGLNGFSRSGSASLATLLPSAYPFPKVVRPSHRKAPPSQELSSSVHSAEISLRQHRLIKQLNSPCSIQMHGCPGKNGQHFVPLNGYQKMQQ